MVAGISDHHTSDLQALSAGRRSGGRRQLDERPLILTVALWSGGRVRRPPPRPAASQPTHRVQRLQRRRRRRGSRHPVDVDPQGQAMVKLGRCGPEGQGASRPKPRPARCRRRGTGRAHLGRMDAVAFHDGATNACGVNGVVHVTHRTAECQRMKLCTRRLVRCDAGSPASDGYQAPACRRRAVGCERSLAGNGSPSCA
jgi:hypothetical protein